MRKEMKRELSCATHAFASSFSNYTALPHSIYIYIHYYTPTHICIHTYICTYI